jgi:non-ribosomal peptide synthetase component F
MIHQLEAGDAEAINVSNIPPLVPTIVPNNTQPGNPAAILCTGGSTSIPKGVILKRSSLRNVIVYTAEKLDIGKEKVLHQTNLNFDVSLSQAFNALANGGTLYISSQIPIE